MSRRPQYIVIWAHAGGRITGLSHAYVVRHDWREQARRKLGAGLAVVPIPLGKNALCGFRCIQVHVSSETPGPRGNRLCERCLVKLEGANPEDERSG